MIAIGYMDPGNWAADLGAGADYRYTLLYIVLLSGLTGMFFQYLSIKLGVVTQCDLAQISRRHLPPALNLFLYVMAEIAIMATDLAEVIGSAIALNLLFGMPLVWGVLVTAADVLVVLQWWGRRYMRYYEFAIILLVLTCGICFGWQLALVRPDGWEILRGFLPLEPGRLLEPGCLLYATAIMGATVMPHNLYLHSSLAKYRRVLIRSRNNDGSVDGDDDDDDKQPLINQRSSDFNAATWKQQGEISLSIPQETQQPLLNRNNNNIDRVREIRLTLRYATIDCVLALIFALMVNATILIVGAAALNGHQADLQGLSEAYESLSRTVGPLAATLFAIALLTSGQSSTVTGTMAGQVVMTGYLGLRLRPWLRRFGTRLLAIVPALVTIAVAGGKRLDDLLLFSQVILNIQLPFAIIPLVWFTSSRRHMIRRSSFPSPSPSPSSSSIPSTPSTPSTPSITAYGENGIIESVDVGVDFIGPRFTNSWLTAGVGWFLSIVVICLNFYLVYDALMSSK
jgi:NRAMP (natural resistance-associated macrophage protein)-like metal ion transporter